MNGQPQIELNENLFRPLKGEMDAELISRPSITFWQDVWRRLRQNPVAMASLIFLLLVLLFAIFAPIFSPYKYDALTLNEVNLPPGGQHWFGTDEFGRDLWVRVWIGARISLFIAVVAGIIDLLVGVILGALAGYIGGKFDSFVMRVIEILAGIPWLVMVILFMLVLGTGIASMIAAMAVTGWVTMARLVRGQVMQLKNQEFILAAKTLGAPLSRIMSKHLLPNVLGIIIVRLTMNIPAIIFTEAILSFLGLGLQPPLASWGVLVNDGFQLIRSFSWNFWFPAIAISLTTLAFNLLGDGLRDAIDPRLRK
ncbi:dipeptide ABC transporter (permease) [[Clostridium] ultunense Esp]|nr:dipeptide ABC transporter (permease) [[Clostridium] ultunense Esp]